MGGARDPPQDEWQAFLSAGATAHVDPHLLSNLDLATTFAELAGIEPPSYVNGISLVPGSVPWRAWWFLLIGNTIGYGPAMVCDQIVRAVGPFELSEYLGLAVVYGSLAVTARSHADS